MLRYEIVLVGAGGDLGTAAAWPARAAAFAFANASSDATRSRAPEREAELHALGYVGLGLASDLGQAPGLAKHVDPARDPVEARLRASLLLARERFVPSADLCFGDVGIVAIARNERSLAFASAGPLAAQWGVWRRRRDALDRSVQGLEDDELSSGQLDVELGDLLFVGLLDDVRRKVLEASRHDAFGLAARCAQTPSPCVLVRVV
ncbi:MAG: hypothetical protein K1X94_32695 [Sandaracinaceae bacterium]|nr:hypothetical protein [Sandaracinaceae bacterium]